MTTAAAGPGRRPRRWPWVALFLLTLPLVNPYVRGDGNGYYAYVRSAVIDHDLDFENEFRHGDPLFRTLYFEDDGTLRPSMRSETGRVVDQWTIGPSLLWLPFFLAAHLVVRALDLLGAGIAADGFSSIYRYACAVGTALYGAAALALSADLAARLAGRRAAALAVVAIWWASSLPVYMYFLPFHVHALAAFAVALFLWCWTRWRPFGPHAGRWAVWGLTAGLMIDVYYLNAVLLVAAGVEWAFASVRDRRAASAARAAAAFAAGTLTALTPHFAVKWIVQGSPFSTGYQDRFFWLSPRLWQVAFSADHGLLLWTPVVLAAVVGLVLWWRAEPAVGGPVMVAFVLFYYVVAAYQNWHGQSSFGNRFFVSLTPAFVVGLTLVVARVWPEHGNRMTRAAAPAVVALAVVWNVGFMYQWGANVVPNRGPVDLGEVARNQLTVVPRRMAGFAWRYLTDRMALTRDVERKDREQRNGYEPGR